MSYLDRKFSWMVVFIPDGETDTKLFPFKTEEEARKQFDVLWGSWTDVFLCKIVDGPRDTVEKSDEPWGDGEEK